MKQITINYQGTDYRLEFTRRSVMEMDKAGFKASDLVDHPMTALPALFAGAFKANHRWVKKDVVDAIFDAIGNRQELIAKLAEMYNEPLEAMLSDPDEKADGKNASWEATW